MAKYTITLQEEEEKALLSDVVSIQEWIENAVRNKVRQCMDAVIEEYTDKQAKKLSHDEKLALIKNLKIKTAKEKQEEFEKSL